MVLLRKYVDMAAGEETTLAEKSIHPHSLRHTTAIHLLKAGVDIATISQWLGHSGLNVTMRYARADIDMKRQALEQVESGSAKTGHGSGGIVLPRAE
ncbi:tyrosine-type recombinase/integrase [Sinorhizobium meliloti]|nr:tyrosine-type recombinase/integrase [Sinorhizobium meliloti]WQP20166.1 tyrosine-type recombinase/integrase [Sinorhizobium meliloti]WQP33601.1 tyrosine-type recombinase/integrase [Sinorhizobium meliloti]